jgi:hypothetical protein
MRYKLVKKRSFFRYDEKQEFFLSLALFLVFLALIMLIFKSPTDLTKTQTCGDSNLYGTCSVVKPYYCEKGLLVEKASVCGCSESSERLGDSCITNLQTEPRDLTLKYIIDGEEKTLNFRVYKGLVDHLSVLPPGISYVSGEKPVRTDFIFKKINEDEQRKFLLPLVIKIKNLTDDKEEQARIAISLVQNIQYGFSNKTEGFFGNKVNYSRYPYEVLYESRGICGEKSELLAFLLREIGYGVVLFYNQEENHESLGIKCPQEESYKGTGYCFVETTGPSIITDNSIEYVGGITLDSQPEVIFISDGESLPEGLQEYKDAETMKRIRQGKFVLFRDLKLEALKERYGLVEEYNIA